MPEVAEPKINWFLWIIGLSSLAVISSSFYFFYFKKEYEFIVETSCDPLIEACFQRDCSDSNNCPPNALSDFKRYTLKAKDYSMCKQEDCSEVCENNTIMCTQVECVEDLEYGESCSNLDSERVNE